MNSNTLVRAMLLQAGPLELIRLHERSGTAGRRPVPLQVIFANDFSVRRTEVG